MNREIEKRKKSQIEELVLLRNSAKERGATEAERIYSKSLAEVKSMTDQQYEELIKNQDQFRKKM